MINWTLIVQVSGESGMFTGPINWFNHGKYFISFKVFVMKTPWLTVLLLWLSIMRYAKQILR
ncbi:MAG: hypothetical protein P8P54_00275 [Pseudomonadales bacterium]|nr:hypothetical protein [Pseudomonadales bacterium]MDG1834393.1 hypothetical protein [Pseudomonadales bacterium]MDG1907556.1 hypothetical protein [Pseudomonadales bacterium]